MKLVHIGVRSYPNGSRAPIWAVMIGNTARAERTARIYSAFGPYSLNATVWTRSADSATWVRTTYQRPKTAEEVAAWHANAEAFSSRQEGGTAVLPRPFKKLNGDLIQQLDSIIYYDDDSAKAYLYPGTSREDAEAIVAAIEDLLH